MREKREKERKRKKRKMLLTEMLETIDILAEMLKI